MRGDYRDRTAEGERSGQDVRGDELPEGGRAGGAVSGVGTVTAVAVALLAGCGPAPAVEAGDEPAIEAEVETAVPAWADSLQLLRSLVKIVELNGDACEAATGAAERAAERLANLRMQTTVRGQAAILQARGLVAGCVVMLDVWLDACSADFDGDRVDIRRTGAALDSACARVVHPEDPAGLPPMLRPRLGPP